MKYYIILPLIMVLFFACNKDDDNTPESNAVDSINMQAGYKLDIYYSLENGLISSEDNSDWDIAFSTSLMTAGILINEGTGTKLYTLDDTTGWDNIDTTGLYLWPELSNNESDWQLGAFNQNQSGISLSVSNYGWGTYYFSGNPDHNVVSDSVYVIRLSDNTWKKIWVVIKLGQTNTYVFKYANIDGTDEQIDSIHCDSFLDKNYVYYSIHSKEIIDREAKSENWDLLFTRYYTLVNQGSVTMSQIVTGVLTNNGIETAKVADIDPSLADYINASFLESKSVIGYDWKEFDHVTQSYSVLDNLCYFLKNEDEVIYKLVFTGFDNTTGTIKFEITRVTE